MNSITKKLMPVVLSALSLIVVAGCASRAHAPDSSKMPAMPESKMPAMPENRMMPGMSENQMTLGMSVVNMNGSQEVPPADTKAFANGTITVSADKSVSGSIMTTGINGMSAHIHEGAAGTNGPVVIALTKSSDNKWVVPPGAMLTDKQYASYMAGDLYVNVHSPSFPTGEIRAQLAPK